jgi:hypothetical protein
MQRSIDRWQTEGEADKKPETDRADKQPETRTDTQADRYASESARERQVGHPETGDRHIAWQVRFYSFHEPG